MKIEISVLTSLYKCEEYLKKYFTHVEKIVNLAEVEFIFIHNDPTEKEKEIIENFLKLDKINYQYIEVPREGLYKSWNRGIKMAKGDFIAVWNVDDVRYPESLKQQKLYLREHLNIMIVYGNKYIITSTNHNTKYLSKPNNVKLKKGCEKFQDGAFLMWRKSVHESVGLFDEQLKICGDQDFWYRVTKEFYVAKIEFILGEFENIANNGLSSKSENMKERIVILFRYGFWSPYFLLDIFSVRKNYDIKNIYNEGKKLPLKNRYLTFCNFILFFSNFIKSILLTIIKIINPKHSIFSHRTF